MVKYVNKRTGKEVKLTPKAEARFFDNRDPSAWHATEPVRTTIEPPYTNRYGCVPTASFVRCRATTKAGEQCRACAQKGTDFCVSHT